MFDSWSVKCGEYPAGDPEIHHVAGSLYAEEQEPYDAERHLILGTKDSPEVLIAMEYDWYTQDESHTAARYAGRAILPYMLIGNIRDANRCLQLFTARLCESNTGLTVEHAGSGDMETSIFPSLPLLNFLGLLILAARKGNADLYKQLRNKYATHLRDYDTWNEALNMIGELYFGIQPPRQGNPLFDMMGSMFGGAGPGLNSKMQPRRIGSSGPPAEGLD